MLIVVGARIPPGGPVLSTTSVSRIPARTLRRPWGESRQRLMSIQTLRSRLGDEKPQIKRTRRINGMPGHREMTPFVSEYGRLDNNRLRQILSPSWVERVQRVAAPLLNQRSYALTRVRASNATRAGCVGDIPAPRASKFEPRLG